MSPTKRPSTVTGLRRGVGTVPAVQSDDGIGRPENIGTLAPPRPEKPVRITLDLDQATHRALRQFAADTGPGVSAAKVLRALLAELDEGPNLAARVRARIWGNQ